MDHPFWTGAPSISRLAIEDGALMSGRYWGELRTFLAVAKARSLNRAADELGVSRMTAGREIRRLQDLIGAQLIVFTKTGAALTRRGEALARSLQRFDQEIHTLTADLRRELRQAEGTVRIGVTEGIGVVFIVPALRQLALTYPRIRVELKTPQNYTESILENRTDLMVGFAQEERRDATSTRMGTLHFLPLVSRSYVARRGRPTRDNLHRSPVHRIRPLPREYGGLGAMARDRRTGNGRLFQRRLHRLWDDGQGGAGDRPAHERECDPAELSGARSRLPHRLAALFDGAHRAPRRAAGADRLRLCDVDPRSRAIPG